MKNFPRGKISARFRKTQSERRGKRLSFFLEQNYEEIQSLIEARPDWEALTLTLQGMGICDAKGSPPSSAAVRQAWSRLKRGKRHPSSPEVLPVAPVISLTIPVTPPKLEKITASRNYVRPNLPGHPSPTTALLPSPQREAGASAKIAAAKRRLRDAEPALPRTGTPPYSFCDIQTHRNRFSVIDPSMHLNETPTHIMKREAGK